LRSHQFQEGDSSGESLPQDRLALLFVLSGEIEYFHRPTGSNAVPDKMMIHAGELFFTPPMVDHVDHIHLFTPAFRALQREAATLGPIRSINSAAGNRCPYRAGVPTLWDWAPHDLAMLLTLVPGPAIPKRAVRLDAQPADAGMAERIAVRA
jgi:hypothetical protein